MQLSDQEINEMKLMQRLLPYRKISGVKAPDGSFEVFANATYAQANNHARKVQGTLYRLS